MANKKIILLFLAALICLITISSASAEEINNSDIISQDVSQSDTIGSFRGYTSFRDLSTLINSANESDTITLDKDYIFHDGDENYKNGISISKPITINGNNHTIDLSNRGSIFTIYASNVVLTNINFVNAIKTSSYNYYSYTYNPIQWSGENGILSNCVFENCNGDDSSVIYWTGNSAKINNCTFIKNNGDEVLLLNSEYGTVTNSHFINNNAISLYIKGQYSYILNSNFINNTIKSVEIRSDDVMVKHSNFINNSDLSSGAGIYWYGSRANLENSSFINNSNIKYGTVHFYNSNAHVDNCDFTNNSAEYGGAIYFNSMSYDSLVYNSNFKSNNAKYGGAIYWDSENGRITKSKFEKNFAKENGVIYWNNPNGKIDDSEFSNNWAKWYGGVIYVNSYNVTIDSNKFKNNSANLGSSIYLTNNRDLVIKYCNFANEDYSIYNKGILDLIENTESKANSGCVLENYGTVSLKENSFKNPIYNKGIITSQTYLTVLKNKTVDVLNGTYTKLTATLYDDNQNSIVGNTFTFYEVGEKNYYGYTIDKKISDAQFSKGVYSYENYWVGDESCPTSHVIYGRYDDNGINNIKYESGTIISKLNPKIKLTVKDIYVTEDAVLTATVNTRATGKIVFNVANTNYSVKITNGKASKVVPGLYPDTYTVKATYAGDDTYIKSSVSQQFKVMGKTASINVSANNIEVGQKANIVVNVPSDATGKVSITLNNKDYTVQIKNGVAQTSVSGLLSGKVNVIAKYLGDDIYEPATNKTTFVVNKVTKYNMNAKADEITEGEDLTVDVTLPKDATGNVKLMFEGSIYNNKTANGVAKFIIKDLVSGEYSYSAIYEGDSKYATKTYDSKVIVLKHAVPVITAPEVIKYYGGSEKFNIYLTDTYNKTLSNEKVSINVNGKTYTATTNKNGLASIAIDLISGSYKVTVKYNGGLYYNSTSITSKITVKETIYANNFTKIYMNDTKFNAKFLDSKGNVITNEKITINVNGKDYTRTTNENGEISYPINLEQGKYPITVTNPVSKEKSTIYVTVLPSIIENKDVIMFYKNGSRYVVRLVGLDGKVVGKGEKVVFNINGVFYTRETNENGYASLSINLDPKTYVITAEYNKCKVSNNIIVKPTLTASNLTKKYGVSEAFTAKLVDGNGKPLVGETITFNINGVFYERTTDNSGTARLNINLMAGKYIITSMYSNGATISNTVTITG